MDLAVGVVLSAVTAAALGTLIIVVALSTIAAVALSTIAAVALSAVAAVVLGTLAVRVIMIVLSAPAVHIALSILFTISSRISAVHFISVV